MPGFFDVTCPKCGKRYGWGGEAGDDPGCPRCGKKEDPATLAHDAATVQDFQCFLKGRRGIALGKALRARRVATRLTFEAAAGQLGVTTNYLAMVEAGRTEPPPDVLRRMEALYRPRQAAGPKAPS